MIRSIFTFSIFFFFSTTVQAQEFNNSLGMSFTKIPAGEFIMGTEDLDEVLIETPNSKISQIKDESPAHTVTISKPFYLGTTEVTQQQWLTLMENKPGPNELWQQKNWRTLPVVSVSWFMAERFVEELNRSDSKYQYRLPTEAEWEYAARAGSTGLRPWPVDQLEGYARFINNSDDQSQPVKSRKPNTFGVYDMIGNAWEWTADWYAADTYTSAARIDPQGPKKGAKKIRRGGSYHCPLHMTRVAYRAADDPGKQYSVLGFRLVAEAR